MRLYEIMQRTRRQDRTSQSSRDYPDEGSSRATSDNRSIKAGSTGSQQERLPSPVSDPTDTYRR